MGTYQKRAFVIPNDNFEMQPCVSIKQMRGMFVRDIVFLNKHIYYKLQLIKSNILKALEISCFVSLL